MSGFLAASKVLVVAGKGGVGKTTVGASVAIAAAQAGADVLMIELEGHGSLAPLLGLSELGYEPSAADSARFELTGTLAARRIEPDAALADYLDSAGLGPLVGRLSRSGAVDVVSTTAPGIRDLVVLGKIRQIEEAGLADLVVVDAPATGHALSLLTSPAGLAASASSGPVRGQADQVLAMLGDDTRCRVMLVSRPEETPVNETVDAAYSLEDEVGVKLAPVVVNGVWPSVDGLEAGLASAPVGSPEAELAAFRLSQMARQQREIERLAEELPLPQILLPYLFGPSIGTEDLLALATQLRLGPNAAVEGPSR